MANNGAKVLIIEDEEPIRKFLRISLENHGYRFVEASTAADGLSRAADYQPELVILDLGLPDQDGMEVIRSLRQWSRVPIIVLSARGREHDKIDALDAGADDYLTKPFSVGELLARVRVALRHEATRGGADASPVYVLGDLHVDMTHRRVVVADKEVHLTPTEYRLLTILVQHAGKVVTHRQLLEEVWGPDRIDEHQYLRVYMGQLRQKLEADPARPRYLITEPGVGYRLAAE
jgi:two-component system KDP operon response regulator KdpE